MNRKPHSEETKLKISKALKGRTPSAETKLKMSLAQKGKTHSKETKLKISHAKKGKTYEERYGTERAVEIRLKISRAVKVNWEKLGVQGDPRSYRVCYEHNKWRITVFERDDYTCQDCGQHGGELEAHHISQWSTHPLLRFVLSNGKTLCVKCHKKVHSKKPQDRYLVRLFREE